MAHPSFDLNHEKESSKPRILLVDDDASLVESTTIALREDAYEVQSAGDGDDAIELIRASGFDLVILDLVLPSRNGFDVCKEVRHDSDVPILMLSGRTDTTDIVMGLEAGADDYLRKPFELAELRARIRSLLRRSNAPSAPGIIRVGALEINALAYTVKKNGQDVRLSSMEFKLLLELVRHRGQVLSRDALLRLVWDYDYLGDSRVVDMAVMRLRFKVEDDPSDPDLIHTVRGIGYRLEG